MFRKNLIVALMAVTAALSGCFNEKLDWRNADVANGKIYKKDANEPFTGKVTGYPFKDLAGRSPQLFKARHLLMVYGDSGDDLINAVCDIQVSKGELISDLKCENRLTRTIFTAETEDGVLHGPFTIHQSKEDDTARVVFNFDNGRLHGEAKILDKFSKDPRYESMWVSGQTTMEKVYDKETHALVHESHFDKGRPDGPMIRYTPDGKTVTYSANYIDGSLEGQMLEVWINEMTYREATYLKGSMRRQIYGNVVGDGKRVPNREIIYGEDGHEISNRSLTDPTLEKAIQVKSTASDPQACVDSWMAAFRKEVGQDAMVTMDQVGEWEGWCKSGKTPA